MNKKIKDFVKNHKKEIIASTCSCIAGIVMGFIAANGHRTRPVGGTAVHELRYDINDPSTTMSNVLGGSWIYEELVDYGRDPNMKVDCVIVGLTENKA